MTLIFRRWQNYGRDFRFQLLMSNSISWVGVIKRDASPHSSRSTLRSPKAFASLCSRNIRCASVSPSLTLLITSTRVTCRVISAAHASGSSSIAWEHPFEVSSRFSSSRMLKKQNRHRDTETQRLGRIRLNQKCQQILTLFVLIFLGASVSLWLSLVCIVE